MMAKYKRWDEKTATSPLGRYLGHYHALFKPFKYKDEANKTKVEEKRAPIIEVHFIMLQIAALCSHVYKRWTYILTCMIEKDEGSAKIHRLQVIHLYKWDLNLLLGIFLQAVSYTHLRATRPC